jgi:hypothetical protein
MNAKDGEEVAEGLGDCLQKAIDGPRVSGRIAALEQRIANLEQRPELKYFGVWKHGEAYAVGVGALTTHAGSLWLATDPTTFTPGTAGSGWRLIVKQGRT